VASGPCPSGVEEQKSLLIALASERFVGVTAHDAELPRLVYDPVARDRRGGGIWVVVAFNGDELDTVPLKNAALDEQMRDGYEVLYGAGCADLVQVDITARTRTFGSYVGRGGGALRMPVVVFKTKLVRDVADTIDWANKESLDFNEIWDTLLLNPRWREELKDLEDGG
jgi:hypothetical protein